MAWHTMPGLPRKAYLPDWIAFTVHLIPEGQFRQRPGYKLWGGRADGSIDHETGNERVGANALMHDRYMHNGAPDQFGNPQYLSYHLTVDGGSPGKQPEIRQMIPLDEVTYQAACGACAGNYDRWSIEQCVNIDGDEAKARDGHEWLVASLFEASGVPISRDKIDRHYDHNDVYGSPNHPDRHVCPNHMIETGYWPTFETRVLDKHAQIVQLRIVQEGAPVAEIPKPTYPAADLPDWFTTLEASEHPTDRRYAGRTAYRCQRNYRNVSSTATTRYTKPYAKGETPSAASGPKVEPDEKLFGIYLWVHPDDGRTWILEETGHWLLASKFTPRVRIDPRTAE